MFTMHVPKYLWGDALLTSTYLINRLPSRPLNFKIPLSTLTMHYPQYIPYEIPLKTFGCTAFIHFREHHRSKLDPRAIKTIFVGYSPTQKGHKCYCPQTRKFYVTYDVTFFEETPYFPSASVQGEKLNESCFWDGLNLPLPIEPLHSTIIPNPTSTSSFSSPSSSISSPHVIHISEPLSLEDERAHF